MFGIEHFVLLVWLGTPQSLAAGDCDSLAFNPTGIVECLDDDGETEVYREEA